MGIDFLDMGVRMQLPFVFLLLASCGGGSSSDDGQAANASDAGAEAQATDAPPSGPCRDDDLGNTAQARSHKLSGTVDLPGLILCPGTEDWFRLDASDVKSFGVSVCMNQASAVPIDFAAYREEFGELYRHTNCGTSSAELACVGTCLMEAPGIYYFRLNSDRKVRYSFGLAYTPPTGKVTQEPPGFDLAPVLEADMAQEVTVCAPQARFYQFKVAEPSTVTIESTMTYSGYYLDFTLTAEGGQHIAYWPQGAGKTRREQALNTGRFMLRVRSAHSSCRMFTLKQARVAR